MKRGFAHPCLAGLLPSGDAKLREAGVRAFQQAIKAERFLQYINKPIKPDFNGAEIL